MVQITIMGAGILGLASAFVLARRGASVRVIERAHPGAGASGGIVGALAPHVPENWNAKKAFQLESLLAAEPFWAEVAQIGGKDPGYAQTGRVQPLMDAASVERARSREASSNELWPSRVSWRVIPASEAPGPRIASPSGFVVHDTLTARLSPREGVAALVAALAALGVNVEQGQTAPDTGKVLWAAGAQGLADLSSNLGQPVGNAVKGQGALLALDWRNHPQLFVDGLHIIPHANGTVAIGSTSERDFEAETETDAKLDALVEKARGIHPELAAAPILERWAGLRPRARSRAPMVGPWPGREGHFVLNGGFKIGFGMAVGLANLSADLLLDDDDRIPNGFRVSDNMRA